MLAALKNYLFHLRSEQVSARTPSMWVFVSVCQQATRIYECRRQCKNEDTQSKYELKMIHKHRTECYCIQSIFVVVFFDLFNIHALLITQKIRSNCNWPSMKVKLSKTLATKRLSAIAVDGLLLQVKVGEAHENNQYHWKPFNFQCSFQLVINLMKL